MIYRFNYWNKQTWQSIGVFYLIAFVPSLFISILDNGIDNMKWDGFIFLTIFFIVVFTIQNLMRKSYQIIIEREGIFYKRVLTENIYRFEDISRLIIKEQLHWLFGPGIELSINFKNTLPKKIDISYLIEKERFFEALSNGAVQLDISIIYQNTKGDIINPESLLGINNVI